MSNETSNKLLDTNWLYINPVSDKYSDNLKTKIKNFYDELKTKFEVSTTITPYEDILDFFSENNVAIGIHPTHPNITSKIVPINGNKWYIIYLCLDPLYIKTLDGKGNNHDMNYIYGAIIGEYVWLLEYENMMDEYNAILQTDDRVDDMDGINAAVKYAAIVEKQILRKNIASATYFGAFAMYIYENKKLECAKYMSYAKEHGEKSFLIDKGIPETLSDDTTMIQLRNNNTNEFIIFALQHFINNYST